MFTQILEVGLLCVGVLLLVVGYRRNHRDLMLVAALVLMSFGTLQDFSRGVIDGYQRSDAKTL
ncbi:MULTISPECIES: hypothetical protein [unclassified Stenotrophomonas]|uniref:hypothetical protein n=1 Tax=unclassified Stenotrophomonas TaxID=196198 RepID=UPI00211765E3|nr:MULTISPECIES: hypothetical protein [unclassified Stenotrophomonas]